MDQKKAVVTVTPSNQKAFQKAVATTAFLAEHNVRDNVKPISDEIFTGAHGELIYLKIVAALEEGSTGVKIQALNKTNDLVWDEGNVVLAVQKGVFQELLLNLGDWDTNVRQLASLGLVRCTHSKFGRDYALNSDCITTIAKLLNDTDDKVKLHGYEIFGNLAKDSKGL